MLNFTISQTPPSPTTHRGLLENLACLQQSHLLGPVPVSCLEDTNGALFTGDEAPSATFSYSSHSLTAQSVQKELVGGPAQICKLRARLYPDVAIKAVGLAVDDSDADSGAILVACLLDGFGAEFVEVIHVDPKEWTTEVLFCRELFEGDGSDDAGHIRISRRSQMALLASRRRLVIVDWAREKMACIKTVRIFDTASRSMLVLVERQDHVPTAEGAASSTSVLVSLANVWKEIASKGSGIHVLLLNDVATARLPIWDDE